MALKILIESSRTNELPKGKKKMKRREKSRLTQTASIHQINVHNQTIVSNGREPHPGRRTYVIHLLRDRIMSYRVAKYDEIDQSEEK